MGPGPNPRWQQRWQCSRCGRGAGTIALGSDGAGSIRIPSTWCGLYGLKPQRDRVPLAPHDDAWCGMSVYGPLAHTVEDAALFLDVTCDKAMPGPRVVLCERRRDRPIGCESR